jgi:hypothetical protein
VGPRAPKPWSAVGPRAATRAARHASDGAVRRGRRAPQTAAAPPPRRQPQAEIQISEGDPRENLPGRGAQPAARPGEKNSTDCALWRGGSNAPIFPGVHPQGAERRPTSRPSPSATSAHPEDSKKIFLQLKARSFKRVVSYNVLTGKVFIFLRLRILGLVQLCPVQFRPVPHAPHAARAPHPGAMSSRRPSKKRGFGTGEGGMPHMGLHPEVLSLRPNREGWWNGGSSFRSLRFY